MDTSKLIADIISGELHGNANVSVKQLICDSRNISYYKECAFFALVSERNNGHKYIKELFAKGVRCFIVSENIDENEFKEAAFIHVKNTLEALQKLSAFHRTKYKLPIIGITGSNGKTVVKEWLFQLLKNKFTICRSPKSYNSQIGVPLSLWNLDRQHTLGIFEAGISTVHEMQVLESIIKPKIGIFTAFGDAHNDGFASPEEKLSEKFILFKHCETVVVQGLKRNQIQKHYSKQHIILVSEDERSDVWIKKVTTYENSSKIELHYSDKFFILEIPFSDRASVLNVTTCVGALIALKLNPEDFVNEFKNLQAIALRLEIKTGINNCILINDFYNSDVNSLQIALNHLHQQSRSHKKTVVLSDIEHSGQTNEHLYQEIAKLLSHYEIQQLIGIGKNISQHEKLFTQEKLFFDSTADFIKDLHSKNHQFINSTILLKGARSFEFEKISALLQQKSHDTVLEINLNHLTNNINYYRGLLKSKTQIMCMVKAMGYGSGSSEIAQTLQHLGINYLAVAYADEGVELRNDNVILPVMVMSPEPDSLEDIINYNLEPEIYSFKLLELFNHQLDKSGVMDPYPIHLKIDTGMKRLGFEEHDIEKLGDELLKSPLAHVKSVFSHLAGTDNPDLDEFTNEQIKLFEIACAKLESKLGYSFLKHICNSGGVSRFKNAHYDMVRLGIGMYGVGVNKGEQNKLQNVGSLKTRISQIKTVYKGQTVGYNRNGKIKKDTTIAIIPIGYADGFKRELGNGNFSVSINNVLCKTVGNVCMDMCMIDITGINCKEGDEVIVFENFEQIKSMSETLHTIPYEVLTGISSRVKRVYLQE